MKTNQEARRNATRLVNEAATFDLARPCFVESTFLWRRNWNQAPRPGAPLAHQTNEAGYSPSSEALRGVLRLVGEEPGLTSMRALRAPNCHRRSPARRHTDRRC